MYTDKGVGVMSNWLRNPELPIPPPEKEYWWKIPRPGQIDYENFSKYDRFQRVAYHWKEANREILDAFSDFPEKNRKLVRLEDVTTNEKTLQEVVAFLGVQYDTTFFEYLKRPRNVFLPMEFGLTKKQRNQFNEICGDMMLQLGYDDKNEYSVKY
jgi:hypothetical protein